MATNRKTDPAVILATNLGNIRQAGWSEAHARTASLEAVKAMKLSPTDSKAWMNAGKEFVVGYIALRIAEKNKANDLKNIGSNWEQLARDYIKTHDGSDKLKQAARTAWSRLATEAGKAKAESKGRKPAPAPQPAPEPQKAVEPPKQEEPKAPTAAAIVEALHAKARELQAVLERYKILTGMADVRKAIEPHLSAIAAFKLEAPRPEPRGKARKPRSTK